MTTIQRRKLRAGGFVSAVAPRADDGVRAVRWTLASSWRRVCRFVVTFGVVLAILGVGAAPGSAAAGADSEGAKLLRSLEAGEQTCGQISDGEFEEIGEYVLGRMVGSTARHDAMDEQMRDATDDVGEVQAHLFMGQRFADCATGKVPDAFGSMMGMMGNYSGANSMMGGGREGNGVDSGRMGGSDWRDGDANERDGFDGNHMGGDWGWLVIVAMVAMMGGMGWMMWSMMRGAGNTGPGSSDDPVDLLKMRYARGDITTDEFQERRQAIEDARS